ncbi:MAG: MBOAT family protein [Chloroflexi bacterium]|nr:MBOAT family protein [Chloroflexota bacterium]
MSLLHLSLFALAALIIRVASRGRSWAMFVVSLLAIYFLQPVTAIQYLDFWLPTLTLALIGFVYAVNRSSNDSTRDDLITALVAILILLALGSLRYFDSICCPTPSTPPDLWRIAIVLGVAAVIAVAIIRFAPNNPRLASIFFILLIVLLLIIKTEPLARGVSAMIRSALGRDVSLASAADVQWLGFSYIAFRLMHILRERSNPRFPKLTLREYINYVIFFPSFTAGPIDRADRFIKDARAPLAESAPDVVEGGRRIMVGAFKKFVIADTLAIISLNGLNAAQVLSPFWAWILLYAFTLRIYFDFGGYTDIAVGVGRIMGIKLPENFDAPYFKSDLTTFWNSWHITLTQWVRSYFFNPLTRALRSRSMAMPLIIVIGQLGTMLLIGLWHGVTWNFIAWGLWHGIGLYAHNRYLDFMKPRLVALDNRPQLKRLADALGTAITFHYVALGWVWFALPNVELSLRVFGKLFNL